MSSTSILSRRRFLATASTTLASPYLIPGSALGKDGVTLPSERITVGMLGCGQRAKSARRAVYLLPEAQIVAVTDPRKKRLDHAHNEVNAAYAKIRNKGSHKVCDAYSDFRDVLARPDIDAVWGLAPDHWHGVMYTQALKAGKDMYGEKPLTRWIGQGVEVCKAVRQYGRVFQTGTHQRSRQTFRHACELARNGYLGKVHTIHVGVPGGIAYPVVAPSEPPAGFDYDMWTGPAPMIPFDAKRCEYLAMYMISHYCAGFITNWGVHHLDIAGWGCPEVFNEECEVEGTGTMPSGGMTDTWIDWQMTFRYPSGLKISFTNQDNPNPKGCRFEGDEGWVFVNRKGIKASSPSLLTLKLKPNDTHLHVSPEMGVPIHGYVQHTADFLRSVRTRQDPASPVEEGHAATTLGNVADIALRLGRKVKWNPKASCFPGDDIANSMIDHPLRSPWTM